MAPFRAQCSIRHDGVSYRPGSILVMDPESSSTEALVAAKAISPVPLDPTFEEMFPSDEEVRAMSKAQALTFAKESLKVDDIPGNADAVKIQVIDLISEVKAKLYSQIPASE